MKHSLKITSIIILLFLLAQFIGIGIAYSYIDHSQSTAEEIIFKDLPLGERPQVNEQFSFVHFIIAILLGTAVVILLTKYKLQIIWKIWFLLAIIISLTAAFSSLLPAAISFFLAAGIGLWRIFKPNFWVHNLSELFIYGGLGAIFIPMLNLVSVSVLLVLIAIYDAYAVWKSKHMVALAKSQLKAKAFAGIFIPYKIGKDKLSSLTKSNSKPGNKKLPLLKVRTAILGGGDLAFPLLFAGVVLKEMGLGQSLVIPLFSAAGLMVLLWKAEEKKFYPAMPFIAAGCFAGLGVVWAIGLL